MGPGKWGKNRLEEGRLTQELFQQLPPAPQQQNGNQQTHLSCLLCLSKPGTNSCYEKWAET